MNKSDYIKLVSLTDEFEKLASHAFDELNRSNLLPGNFYRNNMDSISIDNITKDGVALSYFDDCYDIRDSWEIELPVEVFLDNDALTKYINDKIDAKSKRAKELLQQQETEQNEREYQEFIRLKQKFEGA